MPYEIPLTPEQKRIRALMAGDTSANFAGWKPPNEQQPEQDMLRNPGIYNSPRNDSPQRQLGGSVPLFSDTFKQNTNYQNALRNRLSQISGMSTDATSRALFAKEQQAMASMNNTPAPAVGGKTPSGFIGDMSGNDRRDAVLKAAASQAGMPYSWGGGNTKGASYGIPYKGKGSEKIYGFDCSGLVQYAFGQAGFKMPRWGGHQRAMGQKTSIANLRAGDLVGKPGHVAIYAGNNMMWEAPTFGKQVRLVPIRSGMFGIRINY